MALVVETGAGVAGANSYTSLVDAQAFIDARGLTATLTEGLLLSAMDTLNAVRLRGHKTLDTNPLPCPRHTLYDIEGYLLPSNTIPAGIIAAQIWLAYYALQGSDTAAVATPAIRSETVDVISVDYAVSDGATTQISPLQLPNVKRALQGLMLSAGRIDHA